MRALSERETLLGSRADRSILRSSTKFTNDIHSVTEKVRLRRVTFERWIDLCRYLQYVLDFSSGVIDRPHFSEVILKNIHFAPIPLFNGKKSVRGILSPNLSCRFRTGCRPFVQIFNDEQKKIFSNYEDPNKIRFIISPPSLRNLSFADFRNFTSTETTNASIPINLSFTGDVNIHVNHAPVGISRQAIVGLLFFFFADDEEESLGWRNSNVSTENQFEFQYEQSSRDFLCQVNRPAFDRSLHSRVRSFRDEFDQNDKFPPSFRLWVETSPAEKPLSDEQNRWAKIFEKNNDSSQILFKDQKEFQDAMDEVNKVLKIVLGKRTVRSEEKHLEF